MIARARHAVALAALAVALALPPLATGQDPTPSAGSVTTEATQAAERLFDLPAYRQLATRQLYRALQSLPQAQYEASLDALKDPRVVQVLRGVIVRSMAQTYSVEELGFLARMLATEAGQSIVAKEQLLQDMLGRELLAAALANPELARILAAP